MKVFTSADDFQAAVGTTLGPGPWRVVGQQQVDAFATTTDDEQWIHIDPAKAAAGPFGGTIAHGFLTLSLLPSLMRELYEVKDVRMAVNYGLNKVRFPAPVPVGSSIRAAAEVASVEPVGGDGVQVVMRVTVSTDGGDKPVCVAETVSRLYF
jgi:acyl dehydratase